MLLTLVSGSHACGEEPANPLDKAPSRFAKVDGARVHYKNLGDGPTAVVFIHGWTCDGTFWRAQVPAFAGKVRTVVIDLPGHGQSDKPKVDYTMDYFARAVEGVLRDAGVDQAVLVGHSMGTPVARQFYRLYPGRTRALVAVDGSLHNRLTKQSQTDALIARFTGPDSKEQLGKAIDGMFTEATPAELRRSIKATMLSAPPHVVAGAMRGMLDPSVWKDDPIRVPLLVVVAKRPVWPADHEQQVRKLAPQADYRAVEGVGHFLMMEKPDAFNEILAGFLKRQGVLKP